MSPAEALAALRAAEAADGAPDLGRRRDLLARLAAEVKRRAADIAAAAAADFGARSRVETLLADAVLVADLALFARRRLRRWARPRRVPTPFPFRPAAPCSNRSRKAWSGSWRRGTPPSSSPSPRRWTRSPPATGSR